MFQRMVAGAGVGAVGRRSFLATSSLGLGGDGCL